MEISRGPTGGPCTLWTDREAENVFLLGNKLPFYARIVENIDSKRKYNTSGRVYVRELTKGQNTTLFI